MRKIIEGFPYLTQTDNKLFSSTSCYPTSMAMAMSYCLQSLKLSKLAIGCQKDMQLEDYITEVTESKETKQWIRGNVSIFGSWMLNYKPRTIGVVEEMIFNKLMKPFKFKTNFYTELSYEAVVNHINYNNLPIVLHGDFSSISYVAGHIVCAIGYDTDKGSLIVQDPYGNAVIDKYKSNLYGEKAEYPKNLLIKDKKNDKMWGQVISKIW